MAVIEDIKKTEEKSEYGTGNIEYRKTEKITEIGQIQREIDTLAQKTAKRHRKGKKKEQYEAAYKLLYSYGDDYETILANLKVLKADISKRQEYLKVFEAITLLESIDDAQIQTEEEQKKFDKVYDEAVRLAYTLGVDTHGNPTFGRNADSDSDDSGLDDEIDESEAFENEFEFDLEADDENISDLKKDMQKLKRSHDQNDNDKARLMSTTISQLEILRKAKQILIDIAVLLKQKETKYAKIFDEFEKDESHKNDNIYIHFKQSFTSKITGYRTDVLNLVNRFHELKEDDIISMKVNNIRSDCSGLYSDVDVWGAAIDNEWKRFMSNIQKIDDDFDEEGDKEWENGYGQRLETIEKELQQVGDKKRRSNLKKRLSLIQDDAKTMLLSRDIRASKGGFKNLVGRLDKLIESINEAIKAQSDDNVLITDPSQKPKKPPAPEAPSLDQKEDEKGEEKKEEKEEKGDDEKALQDSDGPDVVKTEEKQENKDTETESEDEEEMKCDDGRRPYRRNGKLICPKPRKVTPEECKHPKGKQDCEKCAGRPVFVETKPRKKDGKVITYCRTERKKKESNGKAGKAKEKIPDTEGCKKHPEKEEDCEKCQERTQFVDGTNRKYCRTPYKKKKEKVEEEKVEEKKEEEKVEEKKEEEKVEEKKEEEKVEEKVEEPPGDVDIKESNDEIERIRQQIDFSWASHVDAQWQQVVADAKAIHRSCEHRICEEEKKQQMRQLLKEAKRYSRIHTLVNSNSLFEQQRYISKWMVAHSQKGIVIAHGLGSGKTTTALVLAVTLQLPTLVLRPASVQASWTADYAQLKKMDEFKHLDMPTMKSVTGKDLVESLKNFRNSNTMLMMTTKTLSSLKTSEQRQMLEKECKDILFIIDEAHNIRNDNEMGINVRRVAKVAQKVVFATATPLVEKPSEIMSYLRIIHPNTELMKKITDDDFDAIFNPDSANGLDLFRKLACGFVSYFNVDMSQDGRYPKVIEDNQVDKDSGEIYVPVGITQDDFDFVREKLGLKQKEDTEIQKQQKNKKKEEAKKQKEIESVRKNLSKKIEEIKKLKTKQEECNGKKNKSCNELSKKVTEKLTTYGKNKNKNDMTLDILLEDATQELAAFEEKQKEEDEKQKRKEEEEKKNREASNEKKSHGKYNDIAVVSLNNAAKKQITELGKSIQKKEKNNGNGHNNPDDVQNNEKIWDAFMTQKRKLENILAGHAKYKAVADFISKTINERKYWVKFKGKEEKVPPRHAIFSMFTNEKTGLGLMEKALKENKIDYVIIKGDDLLDKRIRLIKQFNDIEKGHRVILFSPASAEGVSFYNVNYYHALDQAFNQAKMRQAKARVVRSKSHDKLESEYQWVKAREYFLKFIVQQSDGEMVEGDLETADVRSKIISMSKYEIIERFIRALDAVNIPRIMTNTGDSTCVPLTEEDIEKALQCFSIEESAMIPTAPAYKYKPDNQLRNLLLKQDKTEWTVDNDVKKMKNIVEHISKNFKYHHATGNGMQSLYRVLYWLKHGKVVNDKSEPSVKQTFEKEAEVWFQHAAIIMDDSKDEKERKEMGAEWGGRGILHVFASQTDSLILLCKIKKNNNKRCIDQLNLIGISDDAKGDAQKPFYVVMYSGSGQFDYMIPVSMMFKESKGKGDQSKASMDDEETDEEEEEVSSSARFMRRPSSRFIRRLLAPDAW
eukprot:TRINITY_DN2286_c0_g2_i5.p1 TRINITY_DN2286_c0_g2~~TRINITY_DN2286_c0_g2_i5.p1  ORF type:complete len:1738 (-),score=84.50 TRINITY_DN2286_c0_g2_i5:859-5874(-)